MQHDRKDDVNIIVVFARRCKKEVFYSLFFFFTFIALYFTRHLKGMALGLVGWFRVSKTSKIFPSYWKSELVFLTSLRTFMGQRRCDWQGWLYNVASTSPNLGLAGPVPFQERRGKLWGILKAKGVVEHIWSSNLV